MRRTLLLVLAIELPLTALSVAALIRLLHLSGASAIRFALIFIALHVVNVALYAAAVVRQLKPHARWRRSRAAGDLASAHAAVARAPLLLSVVFSLLWALAYPGALFALDQLSGGEAIAGYENPAIVLFVAAIVLGTFITAYVVHGWTITPLIVEISSAAGYRCRGLPGGDISLRARLSMLLFASMLAPSAWIASFGYLAQVRATIVATQSRAEDVARSLAEDAAEPSPESLNTIVRGRRTGDVTALFVTAEGEVVRAPNDRTALDAVLERRLDRSTVGRDRAHWFDATEMRAVAAQRTPRGDLAVVIAHAPQLHTHDLAATATIFGLLLLIGVWIISHFASAVASREVHALTEVLLEVARTRSARGVSRLPLLDHHELGLLAESMNTMLDRLERAEEEAIEIERFKDEFIRMAAHELKTPIAIIKGYTQLLRSPKSEQQRERSVEAILRGTERMHHLVSELVDICRIRTGRYQIPREPIDLGRLVDQVAKRAAEESGRIVHVSLEHVVVEGDRARLADVCSVLIDNAITYSPQETTVEIDVIGDDDHAVLSVEDHGIGIPAEKRAYILEPFQRAHADTPNDHGGFGVALYLSRLIVERHGGRIWFESSEGSGTRFSVLLPKMQESAGDGGSQDRAGDRG